MSSVGSVDGKDAELHSPVTSPHSSTSGNVSDLSDSSFNISDFLGEKTDNLKKNLSKDDTQGHDAGQTHAEKQGQVRRAFTDDEAKENIQPLNSNYSGARSVPSKDEHVQDLGCQPNQSSKQSTASCSQQSGESAKPAETYISLIAKVILLSVYFTILKVTQNPIKRS